MLPSQQLEVTGRILMDFRWPMLPQKLIDERQLVVLPERLQPRFHFSYSCGAVDDAAFEAFTCLAERQCGRPRLESTRQAANDVTNPTDPPAVRLRAGFGATAGQLVDRQ